MNFRYMLVTLGCASLIAIVTPGVFAQAVSDSTTIRSHMLDVMREAQRLETTRSQPELDSALKLFDSVRQMSISHFGERDSLGDICPGLAGSLLHLASQVCRVRSGTPSGY